MAKYKLKRASVLNGYKNKINAIMITELENVEIYALAIQSNNEKKAAAAIKKNFSCPMPPIGQSALSEKHNLRILRLSSDQLFLFFNSKNLSTVQTIFKNLNDSFYITEQTDAWLGLKVSGQRIMECLERICPINISLDAFKENAFARTVMEHLGTIIIRVKSDEFELFSASSSANSFLHAVETSAKNI